MTPVFDDFEALKKYVIEISNRLYQAAGRPDDFKIDIQSCDPVDEFGYVVEIVAIAGDRTIPARLNLLPMLPCEGSMH